MAQAGWEKVGTKDGWSPVQAPEQKGDKEFQQMISSQFIRQRPPEEARRLLNSRSRYFAGLSFDEQDKILSGLPGPPQANAPIAEGLATGIGKAVKGVAIDLPKSVYHAATDKPTQEEIGRHRRHPVIFAEPQKGIGLTADRLILDPQIKEYGKAKKAAQEGKTSESMGHSIAAGLPGYGPAAAYFGEKLGQGKFAEVVGEAGTQALMSLFTKGITKDIAETKRMSAAAGGGAEDFQVVERDLAQQAGKMGRPTTVGHLLDLVDQTGKKLESDFNIALQPIAGQRRIPNEVAQELLSKANSSHYLKTAEGRQTRALLRQKALDYMRPWSLGELNKQRMDMYNARLEAKTAVGQMNAVRQNAETLANKIIEDKLRDIVYDDIARHYGSSVNVRLLKEKQSRLLDLKDRLEKRVDTLRDAQAEYDASGPAEKLGLSISGHTTGVTPRVHGLFKALKGGPEAAENAQVRKAFPASLKDAVTSKQGAKDFTRQGVSKTTRVTIRNLPLAALYERSQKQDDKPKKKPLTDKE